MSPEALASLIQRVEEAKGPDREIDAALSTKGAAPSVSDELVKARAIVDEQADDGRLWFVAETITEDMLQKALRRLHEAVEGKTLAECARTALSRIPSASGSAE